MIEELEQAKRILSKTFCLMEWHRKDAEGRGEQVMDKEDLQFLIDCSDALSQQEVLHEYSLKEKGSYDVYELIEIAKSRGLLGIILEDTISDQSHEELRKLGYFITMNGHGSALWDEVYLTEEAFVRSQIASFQHLFGCVKSMAHVL